MKHWKQILGAVSAAALVTSAAPALAQITPEEIRQAEFGGQAGQGQGPQGLIAKAQILLDRAYFSPGVIDGYDGANTRKALRAFQYVNGLPRTGNLDRQTWDALVRRGGGDPVLTTYAISDDDVNGPFVDSIPSQMTEMAEMEQMAYTTPVELLAEKFHIDQDLLEDLNPNVDFGSAGTEITVPSVQDRQPSGEIKTVMVDRNNQTVKAYGTDGRLIAFYPATVGSSQFPSPSGDLEVKGVAERPVFTYSGNLEYADLEEGEVLKVPPGPNNPVGIVWIDLSKEGYGIHGTPTPSRISKQASHGCVRLTNWDATELAGMVSPGIPVRFTS